RLIVKLHDVAKTDGRQSVDELQIARRVHRGEVFDQRGEGVVGDEAHGGRVSEATLVLGVGEYQRVSVDGPLPVVDAVDADRFETGRHRVDLAQEVLSGEAPLPQGVGRGVARCGQSGAR